MIRFLTEADMDRIHDRSLNLLETVGVKIQHEAALKQLKNHGASVDQQTSLVKFPRKMVEESLQVVPKEYRFAGRNPKFDISFPLPPNEFITRTNTGAPHYVVSRTNELRDIVTSEQHAEWIRLCDAMQNVDYVASPFLGDKPLRTAGLYAMKSMFENTEKHLWIQPYNSETLPYIMEMACAVAGGKDALRKQPVMHITVGAISPLTFKFMDTEALRLCGEHGVPATIYTLPSMGGTAPVTIAGIVLLTNVELLAGNVITQTFHPGTPVHFLGHKFLIDMSTGNLKHSAVEAMIAAAANSEFSIRKYGIPFHTYGSGSDSMIPDGQSMIERTFQGLLVAIGEGKVFGGLGQLETVNAISPTQLVIDDDIIGMIRKARQAINWDDEHLAAKVIAEVGPGGQFLDHNHTYNHFSEIFRPRTFNKKSRSEWVAEGKQKTLVDNANDVLDQILKTHQVALLPKEVSRELEKIVKKADDLLK
jgi:trimethylamine---corrinoid protein Co-methyltransferase